MTEIFIDYQCKKDKSSEIIEIIDDMTKFLTFYLQTYRILNLKIENYKHIKLLVNLLIKFTFLSLTNSFNTRSNYIFNENSDDKALLFHYYIDY